MDNSNPGAMPQQPMAAPAPTPAPAKKSKAPIVVTTISVMIGIAGAAFGIYTMLNNNQQSAARNISDIENQAGTQNCITLPEDNIKTEDLTRVDLNLAQNLIAPYTNLMIGTIFGRELDDNLRMSIAFYNVPAYRIRGGDENSNQLPLLKADGSIVRETYSRLFNDGAPNAITGVYNELSYDRNTDIYAMVEPQLGDISFSKELFTVKGGYFYRDNNLIIEVYDKKVPFCDIPEEMTPEYDLGGVCYDENEKINERDFIFSHTDVFDVYKMTFRLNDYYNQYSLESIEKL